MKKLFILLLTAVLMVALVACSAANVPETTSQFVNHGGDVDLLNFNTLEEIAAFAKSDQAPDNFVLYDAISILGDFDNYLVFTSEVYKGQYHMYQYNMIDQKQFRFTFKVFHDDFVEPDIILNKTDSMTNMATTGTGETGWILQDCLMYRYGKGNLLAIYMQIDDVQVALSYQDRYREYPVDENGELTTFIERLVFGDEEEALAAADEFITFFRNNR